MNNHTTKKTGTLTVSLIKKPNPGAKGKGKPITVGNLTAKNDTFNVHTKEAKKLFNVKTEEGSKPSPATITRVAGYAATALNFSRNNNPYADSALLDLETTIKTLSANLNIETEKFSQLFKSKLPAVVINVLQSSNPLPLPVTFTNPYGHLMLDLLQTFDYYVRCVKTAQLKALITPRTASDNIFQQLHQIRSKFEKFCRDVALIKKNPDIANITRNDFTPNNPSLIKAFQIANHIPNIDVLTCAQLPVHTPLDKAAILKAGKFDYSTINPDSLITSNGQTQTPNPA